MPEVKLPPVGVVITSHNCEAYVAQAIESVARQTVRNLDVVVVDDASQDRTTDVIQETLAKLKDRRFRFVPLAANLGQTGAARRGLGELSTPFICFLDGDDVWHEAFVERHLATHLNTDFPVGFTYCDSHVINGDGELLAGTAWWFERPVGDPPHRPIEPVAAPTIDAARGIASFPPKPSLTLHAEWSPTWSCNSMASLMFRRSLIDLIYPQADEPLRLYLDHYLSTFGVLIAGSIAIHESLYAYRMHGKNNHSTASVVGGTFATSRNDWDTINRDILQLIHKEMLARRDELCAAVGAGHFEHSLALFTAGVADMNRSQVNDKLREESQDDSGGVLVRLGKLFGNGR
jgi:glycosyltransferase involved in cell wall biosynthesis